MEPVLTLRYVRHMTPTGPTHTSLTKARRHRTAIVLVSIWMLVFAAAFVLAAVYADDDPKTDEAAGFGALAGLVGIVLTVVYLGVSRIRSRAQVVDVLGAVGLFAAGSALAAAVGEPDAALFFGGIPAGVFVWWRHRGRPKTPMPPPAPGRRCPNCQELFRSDLSRCPHCGAESQPWVWHSNAWWAQSRTGAWQWLDESAGTWRWYEDGTPSGPSAGNVETTSGAPPTPEPPLADPTASS